MGWVYDVCVATLGAFGVEVVGFHISLITLYGEVVLDAGLVVLCFFLLF